MNNGQNFLAYRTNISIFVYKTKPLFHKVLVSNYHVPRKLLQATGHNSNQSSQPPCSHGFHVAEHDQQIIIINDISKDFRQRQKHLPLIKRCASSKQKTLHSSKGKAIHKKNLQWPLSNVKKSQ